MRNLSDACRLSHIGTTLFWAILTLFYSPFPVLAAPSDPIGTWAMQTHATLQGHYALPNHLYSQQPDRTKAADLWTAGIQLPALNAIAALDHSHIPGAVAYADALDVAWRTNRWGYIAYGPKIPIGNRYYDDNEWVVLALVETYELTHEQRFLDRAQTLMKFVASGESPDLGGGIWWREIRRDSKNTCSNAPAICCALRLYHFTHDPKLLALAQRIYTWTNANFQDTDGLYFDNVNLAGKIGKTKFSYNSALMLRANCLFYDLTQDIKYLREAQRIADSAEKQWFRASDGAMTDASQFAHLLSEALLYLTHMDHRHERIDRVRRALAFLHDHIRTAQGFYPHRWDTPAAPGEDNFSLMFQASAVRGYAVAARYVEQWH
jgi:Glycosyl hydrolase family 76